MSTTSSPDQALHTLQTTLTNLAALLKQLHSALDSPANSSKPKPTPVPTSPSSTSADASKPKPANALLLLSTTATLLRAQVTKLSLLSLNKPFTPSALTTNLSLYARILPSLAAAAQLLSSPRYPSFFAAEIGSRVKAALGAFEALLAVVPRSQAEADDIFDDDDDAGRNLKNGGRRKARGSGSRREGQTLKGTGVVWEKCDWLVRAAERGVGPLAADKIGAWAELVGDALEELEGWVEEGEGGDEREEDGGGGSSGNGSDSELDGFLGEEHPFREELRPVAERAIAEFRVVRMLFPPLLKRRAGRFPAANKEGREEELPSEADMERLHAMVDACRRISEQVDEVVAALYAGDKSSVRSQLELLRAEAAKVPVLASKNWEGKEDEMTAWTSKWTVKYNEMIAK